MRHLRSVRAALCFGVVCCLCTGCGVTHDVGLAGRCADIMLRAFPSANIEFGKSEASATALTTIIAHVEGVRTDMPLEGPLTRDLAVECQFDNNILTGFRWTAGPLHSSASGTGPSKAGAVPGFRPYFAARVDR